MGGYGKEHTEHLHIVVELHLVLEPADAEERKIHGIDLLWVRTVRLEEDGDGVLSIQRGVELDDLTVEGVQL